MSWLVLNPLEHEAIFWIDFYINYDICHFSKHKASQIQNQAINKSPLLCNFRNLFSANKLTGSTFYLYIMLCFYALDEASYKLILYIYTLINILICIIFYMHSDIYLFWAAKIGQKKRGAFYSETICRVIEIMFIIQYKVCVTWTL